MKFTLQFARLAVLFAAALLAACGGGSSNLGFAEVYWLTSIPEAFQTAQAKNRMVFIAFVGSDWSVASQGAMADALNTETFKNYADDNLVLLRIDFPRKGAPEETAKTNAYWATLSQVDSFPTFALVDPRGGSPTLFWKLAGYPSGGPEPFTQMVKAQVLQRLQTAVLQAPQAPMPAQPQLAPAQSAGAPTLNGMPSPQDLMRQQATQAPPLPTGPSTGGPGASNLPAPDQLMNQMRPAPPTPTPSPAPAMNGLPSAADLMKQVAPTPAAPAAQPATPAQSAAPADTTQPLFNLNQLK